MLCTGLSATAICRSGWASGKCSDLCAGPIGGHAICDDHFQVGARKSLRVNGLEQFADGVLLVITGDDDGNGRHDNLYFSPGDRRSVRWYQRQRDGKQAACIWYAANAYFTTVRPHNFLDDRQTQAGSVFLAARAGWVSLVETLEDVRQSFRWNACAGICHVHLNLRTCPG